MSQLRVSSISTTAGSVNATTSTNGFSLENKPIIAGQMGTVGITAAATKVLFDDFFVQRGITFDSSTRRFTVPIAGIYRITMNPFTNPAGGAFRLVIGINLDAPTAANHRGMCYKQDSEHDTLSLNSVVSLAANDFIVFYLIHGQIYNASGDRFNQFSIERIA